MLTPLYGSFVMGQHSVVDGRDHVEQIMWNRHYSIVVLGLSR